MLKWQDMQDGKKTEFRKKVGFVITKGVWGGAQKYLYLLATKLPKDKYDVFVVTGEGEILKNKLEEKGIRVYVIKNLKRDISVIAEIKNFFGLLKIIYKEQPEVLHLNSPKAGGIGAVVGRLLFINKIIYTVHGWTFNEDRSTIQKSLIFIFSWITVIFCHKVIVISKSEENQAKKIPLISAKKIELIRNGVESIKLKEKDLARKEILKLLNLKSSDQDLWIGTIAELHKNKGFEFALEAMKKVDKNFKYFIIGEGDDRKKIENLIRKYGLENKVYLVGFMDKASEYLKAFDIFILTSMKEGLPYTILEAGLAQLPVIASSIGGIPDIIENGTSGILTTKGRSGEIARALEYMIDKPEERNNFGLKLQEKVKKDFSMDQMLKKTIELYN